jgi:hypothetical protein
MVHQDLKEISPINKQLINHLLLPVSERQQHVFNSVKFPYKTQQIVHLSRWESNEWPATKLPAWESDLMGSIFLAVPPAGSGWRLTQKPKEKST